MNKTNKLAQIWVETAIYTLIGLTLIAIVLSSSLPQIEKIKDRETIKQTAIALDKLNEKILEVREAPSNLRVYGIVISKGKIEIIPENDLIIYKLENTRLQFSEIGEKVKDGDLTIETQKYASRYNIILTLSLSSKVNMTLNNLENNRTLQPGGSQYNLKIYNNGTIDSTGRYIIDISL